MTIAWYGHLRFFPEKSLFITILLSWSIAFFEYCFMIPANRIGYGEFSGFQLKIIQEAVTLIVFTVFALLVLQEKPDWNIVLSFLFLVLAVFFAFRKTIQIPGMDG